MSTTTATPVLQARGLSRQFGSVRALHNVDFEVYPGRSPPSSATTAPASRRS